MKRRMYLFAVLTVAALLAVLLPTSAAGLVGLVAAVLSAPALDL